MLTLSRIVQTCLACPSQWDAWDAEGNYYYLKYRYGHGQVRHYQTEDWVESALDQLIAVVADFRHGHPLDGIISLEEFAERAGIAVAEGAIITSLGDYWRDGLILAGVLDPRVLDEDAPEAT